jgi:DNA-binding NtrC family response regulator
MSTKPKKIFVVDDDKMMAAMISDHLAENPMHEVTVFTTGEDCVKNLALSPDVIILDFNLNSVVPDAANGMQILQQIKKFDPEVHVIMLSSQDDYGKALNSIVKGALEYVVKDQEAFARIDHILGE